MKTSAKVVRVLAILLMGLTAAVTLLSGVGTTCVALAAEKYGPKMAQIAPFQWLYIGFVLVTTAIGVLGIRATIHLLRAHPDSYRASLIALVSGTVVGVIHMLVSRSLRGSSMPVDAVVYFTVLTLAVFAVLRIPAIWQQVDFISGRGSRDVSRLAAACTLLLAGVATLTVQYWAGPTHIFGGVNYADAWHVQLAWVGGALVVSGIAGLVARGSSLTVRRPRRFGVKLG
jgi:hypothetical protein